MAESRRVRLPLTTDYGDDGRIASAGFLHSGSAKNFGYAYLAGTNLLHKLTKPNGMTLHRLTSLPVTYSPAWLTIVAVPLWHSAHTPMICLAAPLLAIRHDRGAVVNDTFAHNTRSELVEALVGGKNYEYDFIKLVYTSFCKI